MVISAEYDNVQHERSSGEEVSVAATLFLQTAEDVTQFLAQRNYAASTVYMADKPDLLHLPLYYYDTETPLPDGLDLLTSESRALDRLRQIWDGQLRLLLHRDHGIHGYGDSTAPGWGTPPWTVEHVRALPNVGDRGFHPVVLSVNCKRASSTIPTSRALPRSCCAVRREPAPWWPQPGSHSAAGTTGWWKAWYPPSGRTSG